MIGDTSPDRPAPDLDALEAWLTKRLTAEVSLAQEAARDATVLAEMIEQVREARRRHPSLRAVE